MTVHLEKGLDYSRFTLLDRIGEKDLTVTWTALDRELSERVCLRIFKTPLTDHDVTNTAAQIEKARGLVHPNIVRTFDIGQVDDTFYICQQYIQNASTFNIDDITFSQCWPMLDSLIDTVIFAHGLGFSHGNLHPGNLLIDDSGQLFVNGFGLTPAVSTNIHVVNGFGLTPAVSTNIHENYQSPDVSRGQTADTVDDIYSIGCLIYRALTGQYWQLTSQFDPGSTVPHEAGAILRSMLAPSAYDRTRDLGHVREVFSRYTADAVDDDIEAGVFTRFHTEPEPASLPPPAVPTLRNKLQVRTSITAIVFFLIIALAGFVFLYLPEYRTTVQISPTEATSPKQTITPPVTQTGPAPVETARIELARTQGRDAASQMIRLQVELEDIGVTLWAGDTFNSLVTDAESGDDLYRESLYLEALASYQKTIEALEQLKASADEVSDQNIKRGDAALESGDAMAAVEAFTIVIAITGGSPTLRNKLERAENLEQVQSHVEAAILSESSGNLRDALRQFNEAQKLDPLWNPAAQGLSRVRQKINQRQFEDAMSVAFSALNRKDYASARASFEEAGKLIPGSPEPEDGILQIELAERMDQINVLKASAETNVKAERWQEAIDDFQHVLDLDVSLVFASQGLAQSEQRLSIHRQLQKFLDDPLLMQDDEELSMARQAIVDASRINSDSKQLQKQIDDLSKLISVARTPINVEIKSDNRTNVTVYRVRQFGKISSTVLALHPGAYTIVGTRPGYRDVQYNLRLMSGMTPEPIYISCSEEI
ncbi:MAG: hypothetical protein OXC84_03660 [Gammaproteobacteria bacterium]|nr:hypothetical protein [Gammaproteobacteria bacterium]